MALVLVAQLFPAATATADMYSWPETFGIAAPGARDAVYDASNDVIYITAGNQIVRYQRDSHSYLAPWTLGTSLRGIDVSPDGHTLAVADETPNSGTGVWFFLVDADTGRSQRIQLTGGDGDESGTFSVAFAADGTVLVSTHRPSGWEFLKSYDPKASTETTIGDLVTSDTMLSASADRETIAWTTNNVSDGPFGLFDVRSKTMKQIESGTFTYEVAVNATASAVAVPAYTSLLRFDGNLGTTGPLPVTAIGVAFHPHANILFATLDGSSQIVAYDGQTGQQIRTYDSPEVFHSRYNTAFIPGRLRTSSDGAVLLVVTSTGIAVVWTELGPLSPWVQWTSPTTGYLRAASGMPIAGATLQLSVVGYRRPGWPQTAATMDDGRFIVDLAPGAQPSRMHVHFAGTDGWSSVMWLYKPGAPNAFVPLDSDGATISPNPNYYGTRFPQRSVIKLFRRHGVATLNAGVRVRDASFGTVAGAPVVLRMSTDDGKTWHDVARTRSGRLGLADVSFALRRRGTYYFLWALPAGHGRTETRTKPQAVVVR